MLVSNGVLPLQPGYTRYTKLKILREVCVRRQAMCVNSNVFVYNENFEVSCKDSTVQGQHRRNLAISNISLGP